MFAYDHAKYLKENGKYIGRFLTNDSNDGNAQFKIAWTWQK